MALGHSGATAIKHHFAQPLARTQGILGVNLRRQSGVSRIAICFSGATQLTESSITRALGAT